jgi:hypothetical protein
MEYVPDTGLPGVRFEFEIDEILAYFAAHIADLEAAPENHSPHKQIVRDHQEWHLQPLIELQAKIRRIVTQGQAEPLTWADSMGWSPAYVIANLLEYRCGIVTCPACQEVYTGTNLVGYDWSHGAFGGRMFTCPHDHELMRSNERIGELKIPIPLFMRTSRTRQAKC